MATIIADDKPSKSTGVTTAVNADVNVRISWDVTDDNANDLTSYEI